MVSQSPRSVAFSAFRAGSLRSLVVRRSLHSRSGFVLVASFHSSASASAFARRWAARLGLPVAVRRSGRRSGASWSVSVPVVVAEPSVFACVAARVSFVGGLRSLVRQLSWSPVWGVSGA